MGSFPRASLLRVEPTGSSFRYKNNFSENNWTSWHCRSRTASILPSGQVSTRQAKQQRLESCCGTDIYSSFGIYIYTHCVRGSHRSHMRWGPIFIGPRCPWSDLWVLVFFKIWTQFWVKLGPQNKEEMNCGKQFTECGSKCKHKTCFQWQSCLGFIKNSYLSQVIKWSILDSGCSNFLPILKLEILKMEILWGPKNCKKSPGPQIGTHVGAVGSYICCI